MPESRFAFKSLALKAQVSTTCEPESLMTCGALNGMLDDFHRSSSFLTHDRVCITCMLRQHLSVQGCARNTLIFCPLSSFRALPCLATILSRVPILLVRTGAPALAPRLDLLIALHLSRATRHTPNCHNHDEGV